MPLHVVKQGECLASIAERYRFADWQVIYEAAENEGLRAKRPNPNVLHVGDEVFVPERVKTVAINTTATHRFVLRRAEWQLRLTILGEDHKPVENAEWELELDDGSKLKGTTGKDGLIKAATHASADHAKLHVLGAEYDVRIGNLNPVSLITGVQQRLANLGYEPGPIDGIIGPMTLAAAHKFMDDHSGEEDKVDAPFEIDDAVRKLLLKIHDDDDVASAAEEDFSFDGGEDVDDGDEEPGEQADIDMDQLLAGLPSEYFESDDLGEP